MSENIIARGKIFELVQNKQPDGRVFEVARRAPGVRLIIQDDQKRILLTKEFRQELNTWDYRLPGGKVFDTLDEFELHRQSGDDMLDAAKRKALGEGHEEAGIEIESLKLFKKSVLGATVEWDLYVFAVNKWRTHESGQQLETGEEIETDNWFTYGEVHTMIMNGSVAEERIALVLLQWIGKEN